MSTTLHITNGDLFTDRLKTLNIDGDIITWREMLCEGKTLTNVGSESFWKTRYHFLHKNYKVSKAWFIEKTLKEYRLLCNHKKQDNIVLWFENDLFCQVNMLAVLSWLLANRKYAQISMVRMTDGSSTKTANFGSLGQDQLQNLYANRVVLNRDDIEFADYVWQLYCSNNPIRLEQLSDFENYRFSALAAVMKSHLERFPSIANGLNTMENNILRTAKREKLDSRPALVKSMLDHQGNLGFGDSQYERAITRLKPLFTAFNPVKLSKKGRDILAAKTCYYAAMKDSDAYLGGALKYNFLYNTDTGKILKL